MADLTEVEALAAKVVELEAEVAELKSARVSADISHMCDKLTDAVKRLCATPPFAVPLPGGRKVGGVARH